MKRYRIPLFMMFLTSSLLLASCLFGIRGSGKVVKSERQVEQFEAISASAGIEVILLQDSIIKVVVEADDNLQPIIKTEVSNGELRIFPQKPISYALAKRVFVSFKTLHSVEASSGSDIKSKMALKLELLNLSASSGASINLKLLVNKLSVEGSSGGNIDLSGSAESMDVDGSSGANIRMSEVQSKMVNAGASSGANLKIFASEKIVAKASSGGGISVEGNPKERNIEKSSGGDITFR